ncbi:MAG: triacylglycerol lipase [Cognaticolwellia sp.]|jgi:triacylglycerol lipase
MSKHDPPTPPSDKPGMADHAVSALNAWIGDDLAESGNSLHQPMAFMLGNRPLTPAKLPSAAKVCVLVHGLGCNESMWMLGPSETVLPFGTCLQRDHGYLPLFIRYNTGQRISDNGAQLAALLAAYVSAHLNVEELLLVGHSMGGLVIRSACHQAQDPSWTSRIRHIFYLGSPHLGAPLERTANVATHLLSKVPTTATRVIGEVINTRSKGVKDLRYGNLSDRDWLDYDPDALLENQRIAIPWLERVRHHRIVGELLSGVGPLGDAVVPSSSAQGDARGLEPGAPDPKDVQRMPGLHHLAVAQHPRVYGVVSDRLGPVDEQTTESSEPNTDSPEAEAPQGPEGKPKAADADTADARWKRVRGIKKLIHDSVDRTATFVERHHRQAAEKPFRILEQVDGVAAPAKLVEQIYFGVVGASYEGVRVVNKIVEGVDDWVVDGMQAREEGEE